jgi:AcrR family transcriptional regulator
MEIDASHRKEYIILHAIDLINENGINNVSTKEIAKRLYISEGLIFKLFPKKSDLILAVLEHFCIYDRDMFYSALERHDNALEAIRFYVNSYMIYYENYPAITAVYQAYDTLKGDTILEQKVRDIFFSRIDYFTKMIEKAKNSGLVQDAIDAESIATIISSIVRGICLKWRLSKYSFSLKENAAWAVNLVLEAIKI